MYFLCAKFKGIENKHVYMSFYHHICIACNLTSSIKKSNISIMQWVIINFILFLCVSQNFKLNNLFKIWDILLLLSIFIMRYQFSNSVNICFLEIYYCWWIFVNCYVAKKKLYLIKNINFRINFVNIINESKYIFWKISWW